MPLARNTFAAPAPQLAPTAVVVGGGVAGLVAARELAISGHAVDVVEAGVAGGRVGLHTVDGLDLDTGAEAFATRNTAVADLAADLGLHPVLPSRAGAWLHTGPGRDLPLPSSGVVGIPGDPRAEEVVAALGQEEADRAAADLETPVDPELLSGPVSLGTLVRARLGEASLKLLVAPVVSGVHSADPDLLDADVVAPGLRAGLERTGSLCRAAARLRAAAPSGSAVAGLPGGMNTLVSALLADLRSRGVRLHEHTRAERVQRTEEGWRVTAAGRTFGAERLVVATDGPAAVDLLADAVPALAGLRPQGGTGIALVTLVVDAPDLDAAPRGSGVLVSPAAGDVRAKALTHATAKWPWLAQEAGPGRHVLRLSYGRITDGGDAAAQLPDAELIQAGIADAATLLATRLTAADVLAADVVRHAGALPMATLGHRRTLAEVTAALEPVEDLDVVGAWRSGTGLAAVVADTARNIRISAA